MRVVLVLLVVLALLSAGCSRCQSDARVVAELESKQGNVDRDFSTKVGTWQTAEVREKYSIGDGVRTATQSRAMVKLGDRSKLRLESSTLVRFLDRPSNSRTEHLNIEMGEAELSTAEALELQTEVGLARIDAGTTLKLRRKADSTRFEVAIGSARFETSEGETVVKAGEGIEIGIGKAVIEQFESETSAKPDAGAPQTTPAATTSPATGDISAEIHGAGKLKAPGSKDFVDLTEGTNQLQAGTTLRLNAGTSALIRRGDEQATLQGAGEFVIGVEDSLVKAKGGSVTVRDSGRTVTVTVPGGTIMVDARSRANMRVGPTSSTVNVESGTATVRTEDGDQKLQTGEEASIDRKGAFKLARGRGPAVADLVVGAGDSVVVHDPKPPTAIGFPLNGVCPRGGVVELGANSSGGEGLVNILAPAGTNRYRIRCVTDEGLEKKPSREGTLSILRDSGTRQLPRTPPPTQIDTDGRNYTVLYQNQLPKLSVRWPSAPAGGSFTLHVSSPGGKSRTVQSGSATYSFPSGGLGEGSHQLWFEGGGKKSKTTTLNIRFDNAAPTASLTSPAEGGFAQGGSVTVSGTAMPGWSVFVGNQQLAMDDQQRFSGTVPGPSGQRGLAIRFAHPQRGVHLYLRRAGGGS